MQSTLKALDELTTCTICLDTFTRPKSLPCQHSYCYSCLLQIDGSVNPEHEIPEAGIAGFRNCVLMNNVLAIPREIKTEVLCSDCSIKPAIPDPCDHCDTLLCGPCLVKHAKLATEIATSLDDLKEYLESSNKTAQPKGDILKQIKTNLEKECVRMKNTCTNEARKKLYEVKTLLDRSSSLEGFVRKIIRIYDEMTETEGSNANRSTYVDELAKSVEVCAQVKSLQNLKNIVADLRTCARLIQMSEKCHLRFNTDINDSENFGKIEFGHAIVDIKGEYEPRDFIEYIREIINDEDDMTGENDNKHENDKRSEYSGEDANGGSSETSEDVCTTSKPPGGVLRRLFSSLRQRKQNALPTTVDYSKKGRVPGEISSIEIGFIYEHEQFLIGCACDVRLNEIFVANCVHHRVVAYGFESGDARIFYMEVKVRYPCDVALSSDGQYVYIVAEGGLSKVKKNGEHVKTITNFSLGDLDTCRSVTCRDQYTILAECRYNTVVIFNADDEEIRFFELTYSPWSIAVSNDTIFVSSESNSCVHIHDWYGRLVRIIAKTETDGDLDGIAVDGQGNVCVSRYLSHVIDVYKPTGERITTIGSEGSDLGQFDGPRGLCFMPDGRLVVVDYNNYRLQII